MTAVISGMFGRNEKNGLEECHRLLQALRDEGNVISFVTHSFSLPVHRFDGLICLSVCHVLSHLVCNVYTFDIHL